jgi:hypothetical protein
LVIYPLPRTRREGVMAAEGWRLLNVLGASTWSEDHGFAFFREE